MLFRTVLVGEWKDPNSHYVGALSAPIHVEFSQLPEGVWVAEKKCSYLVNRKGFAHGIQIIWHDKTIVCYWSPGIVAPLCKPGDSVSVILPLRFSGQ